MVCLKNRSLRLSCKVLSQFVPDIEVQVSLAGGATVGGLVRVGGGGGGAGQAEQVGVGDGGGGGGQVDVGGKVGQTGQEDARPDSEF